MIRRQTLCLSLMVVPCMCLSEAVSLAEDTGSAFTYQGRLDQAGQPVNNSADLQFTLWDAEVDGNQIGELVQLDNIDVVEGLITVELDFGVVAFDGSARWLEVSVRSPSGSGAFQTLSPRQRLNPAPYAIHTRGISVNEAGSVGIGTSSPSSKLTVVSDGSAVLLRSPLAGGTVPLLHFRNPATGKDWVLRHEGTFFHIQDEAGAGSEILTVDGLRNAVGIGTTRPNAKLDIRAVGDGASVLRLSTERPWEFRQVGSGSTARLELRDTVGSKNFQISAVDGGILARFRAHNDPGLRSVTFCENGGTVNVMGLLRTEVLEITGGSDLAEPFNVADSGDPDAIRPGMVVVIDPQNPGQLRLSSYEYDPKVAGIISGAKSLRPGMVMRSEGDPMADGDHPVALTGRVWCWCDAGTGGLIQPGDLLTTSSTEGHAMKAGNAELRQGAVLGKAMTGLPEGTGLVLVLVTLQ